MSERIEREDDPEDSLGSAHELYERIFQVTRQIPPGCVATYGQVALIAGATSARLVGRAMGKLPAGSDVPWFRVINSQGKISVRRGGGRDPEQRRRLKAEGVFLDRQGRVDFATAGWAGPSWEWLEANGFDIEDLILRSQAKDSAQRRKGAWVNWRL